MQSETALLGRTGQVGAGVLLSGIGTLAMLAVSAHGSSPRVFAVVATWWILATLVAFPFGVFESYLTRLVVADRAQGRDPRASLATMAGRAGVLTLLVVVVATLLDPVLDGDVFGGSRGLGLLLGVFCVIGAAQALLRGYAAGHGRFGVVSLQLSSDGIGRAGALSLVVLLHPDDVHAQAAAICVGAALSVVVSAARLPHWRARPRVRDPRIRHLEVIALLVGAVGPILINNLSVPWLSHRGSTALLVGAFSGALTLSRVPVQLAGAAFGPLLTEISHLVEAHDVAALRRVTVRAVAFSAAIAALSVAGFTLLGPCALGVFIGGEYVLPTWVFLSLGSATGVMLVAIVVQSRVAAQGEWVALASSWFLAALVFLAVLPLPLPVLSRAALSPLAASVTGLVALVVVIRVRPLRAAMAHSPER